MSINRHPDACPAPQTITRQRADGVWEAWCATCSQRARPTRHRPNVDGWADCHRAGRN